MVQIIARSQLTLALERCCDAHPSCGPSHKLHPDASLMADLLGLMLHHRHTSMQADEVEPDILAAYQHWEAAAELVKNAENKSSNAT